MASRDHLSPQMQVSKLKLTQTINFTTPPQTLKFITLRIQSFSASRSNIKPPSSYLIQTSACRYQVMQFTSFTLFPSVFISTSGTMITMTWCRLWWSFWLKPPLPPFYIDEACPFFLPNNSKVARICITSSATSKRMPVAPLVPGGTKNLTGRPPAGSLRAISTQMYLAIFALTAAEIALASYLHHDLWPESSPPVSFIIRIPGTRGAFLELFFDPPLYRPGPMTVS
ncbi:hypothetical protein FB451DRAFT_1363187 [Mycena latifolia]|nr:hypothetical protein FB451DRAFT_1363187 [Mycena latifolia]